MYRIRSATNVYTVFESLRVNCRTYTRQAAGSDEQIQDGANPHAFWFKPFEHGDARPDREYHGVRVNKEVSLYIAFVLRFRRVL